MADQDDVVLEPEENGEEATVEQKLKKLRQELKEAKKEAGDNLAGWQRAKADYINLERRMRSASADAAQNAARMVALGFIPAIDSLEAATKGDTGVNAIVKQADEALKAHGIIRFIPVTGERFDPARHESVQVLATDAEEEDNTVSETLQSGYEMSGIIIRPARVIVKHHV